MPDISIIQDESLLSPFMASTHGLDRDQLVAFLERFNHQPQMAREFVTSMDTFAAIKDMVTSGVIPPEYAVAVAKLVTFIAFDEVQSSQVPTLLQRLGISEDRVSVIVQSLATLLRPLQVRSMGAQSKREQPPAELKAIPPLTQRIATEPPPQAPVPGFRPTPNTIVDLRNKPLA